MKSLTKAMMKKKPPKNKLDDFIQEFCPVCEEETKFYLVYKMVKAIKIPFRKNCTICDYLVKLTPDDTENILVDDN
ncbi:hypothetical protein ACFL35_00680 [Candidatus Riflebacteria bacterium]